MTPLRPVGSEDPMTRRQTVDLIEHHAIRASDAARSADVATAHAHASAAVALSRLLSVNDAGSTWSRGEP